MYNKRGQAAMEFLMTYGWAILAAIIAIGVLAYFGVFSPGQYIGSSTIVTAPFYANAWNVQQDIDGGTIGDQSAASIELVNNGGETLTLISLDLTGVDSGATTACTTATLFADGFATIDSSEKKTVEVSCVTGGTLLATNTFRADITITYQKQGSTLDLTSTGSITDTVVKGFAA